MPDLISRRIGVKGQKRYMQKFLQMMAKKASERAYDSYLYEQILRPNEIEAYHEDYGLTKDFDNLSDEKITQFVSSGSTIRAFASHVPFEDIFNEIVKQNPELEFYAEVRNEGGIQETDPYINAFYSEVGQQNIKMEYIQVERDIYAEELWDELEDEDIEENDDYADDEEPFLSEEQIDKQYLENLGKPHKYFDKLLDENKNISSSEPALQRTINSIIEQAGFTFDGANFDDGDIFTAEQRLQSFFDNKPVYHENDVVSYIEIILCNSDCIQKSNEGFDFIRRVTYDKNPDQSVLFAKYERQEIKDFNKKAENTLARFCKVYAESRIYGCYGTKTERKYFYSEQGEEVCKIADIPQELKNGGGTPLAIPEIVKDTEPPKGDNFISIDFRGSIENYVR